MAGFLLHTLAEWYFVMSKYIKIKKAELTPDKFGNKITITMIGLYDENDKWIKWIKLNDFTLSILLNNKIELEEM